MDDTYKEIDAIRESKQREIDVYKRQGMTREMVIAAWGEPYHKSEVKKEGRTLETLRFSDNRYVEPVSYTHLDVYKRQEQSFSFTKAKQARGFTSAKRSGGCAVSQ